MRWVVATLLLLTVVAAPATASTAGVVESASTVRETPNGAPNATAVDVDPTPQQANGSRITYLSLAGRGFVSGQDEIVDEGPAETYVWASEALEFRTTVETDMSPRPRRTCVRLLEGDGAVEGTVDCEVWNSSTRHRWSRIELSAWPAGSSGNQSVRIDLGAQVRNESATTEEERTEWVRQDALAVDVYVISKQGDLDDDGLSNGREVEVGTDFTRADTDGDGLSDRAEVYEYDTDPLVADTAGDGLEDGTVAGLGLPPTVPYVVHGVVTLALLGTGVLVVAGVKLRRVIQAREAGTDYGGTGRDHGVGPPAETEQFPQRKEDEIVAVLRDHEGQMRQADLVDETEWSKATVSRLLSTLEEEDRVEKIRVGRGNVVRLTPRDPAPDEERTQASG